MFWVCKQIFTSNLKIYFAKQPFFNFHFVTLYTVNIQVFLNTHNLLQLWKLTNQWPDLLRRRMVSTSCTDSIKWLSLGFISNYAYKFWWINTFTFTFTYTSLKFLYKVISTQSHQVVRLSNLAVWFEKQHTKWTFMVGRWVDEWMDGC